MTASGSPASRANLYAVAFVGGAGHNLAQESDGVAALFDQYAEILNVGQGECQVGQFMVMLLQRGFLACMASFLQRNSATDQAMLMPSKVLVPRPISSSTIRLFRRGIVQDVGRLLHFHHKGGATARKVIAGAYAGEYAVNHSDFRRGGRNKTAHVRHDGDQSHLPDIGGFAGHVRAGDVMS